MAGTNSRRASRPDATNWDKISAKTHGETLANRDVYEDQQLDRSRINRLLSKTSRTWASVIVALLVASMAWGLFSIGAMMVSGISGALGNAANSGPATSGLTHEYQKFDPQAPAQAKERGIPANPSGGFVECYFALDPAGNEVDNVCHPKQEDVPVPQWYKDQQASGKAPSAGGPENTLTGPGAASADGLVSALLAVSFWKVLFSLALGGITFGLLYPYLMRNLQAQNLMNDTTDINQYANDQHIALPEEIQRKFDWFPDVGAHSDVQPSSMISHMMLTNKGLKKVAVARRAATDMLDDDGDVEYLKGEILRDDYDNALTEEQPIIDEAFGSALFDASGLPADKSLRKFYDVAKIPYNPGNENMDKLKGFNTVGDLINGDWDFPEYEVQRPGGAYIVDTAPVNTMVLAITRAGKGQTYIEPMLDMWMREKRPNNMVINDPKGELLVKNYVKATMRGFQVVQFNLINAMKTDIYNPLGMAADAAREGDATKCAIYVENIADVFFPTDTGEDPVWPNAANNAFKRAAYGLIDFYLEEERELRELAARTDMDPQQLEVKLDTMWGKVTLYNCYQLFVQLTSKKMKNPLKELEARFKAGEFEHMEDGQEIYDNEFEIAQRRAVLWEDKTETDMLTLYFSATEAMPVNTMRTLIANANNALKAMAGAEKMLASVYGIAITAMSFFTDPTISTLTSGTPSQNTDLGGLSFPRRMGVRFGMNYLKRDHLIGSQAKWDAYNDPMFTEPLGADFEHEDIVSREGWARYYFPGKFPTDNAYLRLRLVNPQTQMLIRTMHFHFRKDYQSSLNGRYYITDPVTGSKIVKNGILLELRAVTDEAGTVLRYEPGHTTYPQMRLDNVTSSSPEKVMGKAQAIISTMVRYSEAPKMVFLVTPPHLMKYAKLILILIKQLVDLNFDKSYMTKSNQKPLYKTRFMLDELGNLQSEGHGIAGFETMLSIGLGQEQQFTLILQTLQQLRDVYGESVDKVVQGNTSNIVFLKSTDDSMIDTLQKMSGIKHRAYTDSKTVTKDMERLLMQTEGKVSYTMSVKEEPVISYNDMAFISERNSIVFRAGDSPVWNRNETILPMSWRLFKDTIQHAGHDYTLQTIPTLSSALDFDVRLNQPDFTKMLAKRMAQAERAPEAKQLYQEAYGHSDYEITRLDPDVYSDEVMGLIESMAWEALGIDPGNLEEFDTEAYEASFMFNDDEYEENTEVLEATARAMEEKERMGQKIYAGSSISRDMLVNPDGSALLNTLDAEIVAAYKAARPHLERDTNHFSVGGDGSLRSKDGRVTYISRIDESAALREAQRASRDDSSRVFAEDDLTGDPGTISTFLVHGEFYEFLGSLDTWQGLAQGEFDREMSVQMRVREV
ncbi:type IV secretory system conjugative DNA transfer family protein [Micrococcaceae bacterium Sec7.4]